MRRDVALALSAQIPYQYVETLDDRIKATYWELLEEAADRQKDGG